VKQTSHWPGAQKNLLLLMIRGQGRPLGAAILLVLLLLSLFPSLPALSQLRMALFDSYQKMAPRVRTSAPAVIVAIDEKSLEKLGQWPWPRTLMANLIEAIGKHGPAAIGVDVLMPESDRMSPDSIAGLIEKLDPKLAQRLARLPSNDSILATALQRYPVALGIAGIEHETPSDRNHRSAPFRIRGSDPTPHVRHFAGTLRSLEQLEAAAPGHGLLSVDTSGGIVRRVNLIASIEGVLTPALSMEVLRLATHTSAFVVIGEPKRVKGLGIGEVFIPTDMDGTIWVHFGPHDENRFLSASDVLDDSVDEEQIRGKIALIGATGLGLLDYQTTPLGERIPGIEVHSQILENIFEEKLLQRPAFLENVERIILVTCGLILIFGIPAVKPKVAALIYVFLIVGLLLAGFSLYKWQQLLVDMSWATVACTILFGVMLTGALIEADRQRRTLRQALANEREAAARAAGELEAAQRIQMGMLPPPSADAYGDSRFSLHALIEPAKSVGGDLYDFFKLDSDRLFFMVGDVAGKGLPASIFMAVSKVLYKSTALRMDQAADVGAVMRAANAEISRDNPETLFVTVFAGILNLQTGELNWCNAGHDVPFCLRPDQKIPKRLLGDSGPPLCVIEGYAYRSEQYFLLPGEALCLFTDGVTEAMNDKKELYGRHRLYSILASSVDVADSRVLLNAIRDDVRNFVLTTERSDDLTILALLWRGGRRSE
jgi:adenylate cyclase